MVWVGSAQASIQSVQVHLSMASSLAVVNTGAYHINDLEGGGYRSIFIAVELYSQVSCRCKSRMSSTDLCKWQMQRPGCHGELCVACMHSVAQPCPRAGSCIRDTHRPTTALLSPMSCRSSMSSHIDGYATLTSSTSTVSRVKPARPRRLDMSRESTMLSGYDA